MNCFNLFSDPRRSVPHMSDDHQLFVGRLPPFCTNEMLNVSSLSCSYIIFILSLFLILKFFK